MHSNEILLSTVYKKLFMQWNVSILILQVPRQRLEVIGGTREVFQIKQKSDLKKIQSCKYSRNISSLCREPCLHNCGSLSTGVSNLKSGGKSSAARG